MNNISYFPLVILVSICFVAFFYRMDKKFYKMHYKYNSLKINPVFAEQDLFFDEDCGCHRVIPANSIKPPDEISNKSFCSQFSTLRGSNQNVISFSLYGEKSSPYFQGIQINVDSVEQMYPGYVFRLYTDTEVMEEKGLKEICKLMCQRKNFDICPVQKLIVPGGSNVLADSFGMLWRFAPMVDPLVSEWHSRDLDSRIDEREVEAVREWKYKSNKTFHVMRDHPYHGVPILGGMFGMRMIEKYSDDLHAIFLNMTVSSPFASPKGTDQNLLAKLFFPIAKKDIVSHDSYFCNSYGFNPHAFPTRRRENVTRNYVGSDGHDYDITITRFGECPRNCRPKDHKDWTLC